MNSVHVICYRSRKNRRRGYGHALVEMRDINIISLEVTDNHSDAFLILRNIMNYR